MADIDQIDTSSLPEIPKSSLVLDKTFSEMETEYSEQYLIRLLVDKLNELIVEVNTLKNS
tara:strand:+ start:6864 stop:7043 length:180 start_codon:yes stop_codon:yes gene_type:complete